MYIDLGEDVEGAEELAVEPEVLRIPFAVQRNWNTKARFWPLLEPFSVHKSLKLSQLHLGDDVEGADALAVEPEVLRVRLRHHQLHPAVVREVAHLNSSSA